MSAGNVVSIWKNRPRGCSVGGCEHQHHALGFCRGHYDRRRRTGEIAPDRPLRSSRRRIELCGCAEPRVGRSGVVCVRCSHPNLAAMLHSPEPFALPAAVTEAIAAAPPGLKVCVL